jgi:endonuclease/exonuclease/phosphatase (EEP) superfamily protein YafD
VLAAARRTGWAITAAAFALCAALAVVPEWLRGPVVAAEAHAAGGRLRVMAMNLLRSNDAGFQDALQRIRAFEPDVLFCSEATPEWHAWLAAQLTELPHRAARPDPGYFGVALFSRWPLEGACVIPLGVEWAPAVRAVVRSPAGDVGVLGVHTPRPGAGRRCAERDRALAAIAPALADLPAARIVLGDFNATPWNHAFAAMRAAAGLAAGTTDAWRPTWPAHLPFFLRLPIDHVLLGGPLALEHAPVGAAFGSDHLPLTATITTR